MCTKTQAAKAVQTAIKKEQNELAYTTGRISRAVICARIQTWNEALALICQIDEVDVAELVY